MDINKQDITINKYITGELKGSELAAFEQRLEQDQTLAKDVKFYQKLEEGLEEHYQNNAAIDENERKAFKQLLSEVMTENEVDPVPSDQITDYPGRNAIIKKIAPVLTLAAAALLLFFFWPKENLPGLANQFDSHHVYQSEPTLNSGKIDGGIQAYKNKDYPKAYEILSKNNGGDLDLKIVLGYSAFKLQKHNDAINSFNEVIEKTGNSNLKNTAIWYKALTYLQKENRGEAIKQLKLITEDSNFHKQAQNLLKKLDKFIQPTK